MRCFSLLFACSVAHHAWAAPTQPPAAPSALSQQVRAFVAVDAPVVALAHVRVNIRDLENVDVVFKDGVGFDADKLVRSVRGQVGLR